MFDGFVVLREPSPMTSTADFGLEEFGRVLRRLRQERRLTQEELAEKAGVSSRYVALIEAGSRNPTLTVILGLAASLQVHPFRLFKPSP